MWMPLTMWQKYPDLLFKARLKSFNFFDSGGPLDKYDVGEKVNFVFSAVTPDDRAASFFSGCKTPQFPPSTPT